MSELTQYDLKAKALASSLNSMLDSKGNAVSLINFELLPAQWRDLASKPDKTEDEVKKLDEIYKTEITAIAAAYLKNICRDCGMDPCEYMTKEDFINYLKTKEQKKCADANSMDIINISEGMKQKITKNAERFFSRLTRYKGKDIIDKKDFAAYLYALDWGTAGENKNKLNGIISSADYAVNYYLVHENADENLMDLKLKYAYKNLFGEE